MVRSFFNEFQTIEQNIDNYCLFERQVSSEIVDSPYKPMQVS